MERLICGYEKGCELVCIRIDELTAVMENLKRNGDEEKIAEQNLEQRIKLLHIERRQTQEIISHLRSYMRRKEQNVKKDYLL